MSLTVSCGCDLSGLTIGVRPTWDLDYVDDAETPAPADPSALVIRVLKPDGATDVYTHPNAAITNTAVGEWHFQFPAALMLPGEYVMYALASGGGVDVGRQRRFTVHDIDITLP